MSSTLRFRTSLPGTPVPADVDVETSASEEKRTAGALLSKVFELQQRNMELETSVSTLKYQIELMRNKLKLLDDSSGDDFDMTSSSSFRSGLMDRSLWLTGLLIFQSCSSFILQANQAMIDSHPAVIYFLTMLVGAGGNAGNQAAVRAIRAIAVGALNIKTRWSFVLREFYMALSLSMIVGIVGLVRSLCSPFTSLSETFAICVTLIFIVFVSIILGSTLPLLLQVIKVDPAHSSTSINVIMDILGVLMTCGISMAVLRSSPSESVGAATSAQDIIENVIHANETASLDGFT
jgi:hypothetical protein